MWGERGCIFPNVPHAHKPVQRSASETLTPAPQSYGCTDKQLKRLQRVCGIREGARPLDRQYLFNVYTHPSSSYKGAATSAAAGLQNPSLRTRTSAIPLS